MIVAVKKKQQPQKSPTQREKVQITAVHTELVVPLNDALVARAWQLYLRRTNILHP
jgi:hypothetical protein